MKRAATYARFSTANQSEVSIDDQREACRDYAKANGLKIIQEFSDPAISGAAFGNRPGVRALERAAFAREIDVILIADLTRLSRSSADLAKFLERLRFRGVRVIGVIDRFDSDQRHSRMQAGLSGIMSDEYRMAVAERVHLALTSLARQGKPLGGNLYGYSCGPGARAILPEQARVVREMFTRAAAGEALRAIALDFNRRGLPSFKRGQWTLTAINHLLRNPHFIGRIIWNKTQMVKDPDTGKRTARPRPQSEWQISARPDLAIIKRDVFDAVQARFALRRKSCGPKGGARARYPLSGLLECALCGANFILTGGGNNRNMYHCSTAHYGGKRACANDVPVYRQLCEDLLVQPALDELLSPQSVETGAKRIRQAMKASEAPASAPELLALDAKEAQVRALVKAGSLDADLAAPLIAQLAAERAHARRRAQIEHRSEIPFEAESAYREHAAALRRDLKGEDADAARAALVELYGERIPLRPKGRVLIAEITWPQAAVQTSAAQAGGAWRIPLTSAGPLCTHIPLIPKGKK